MKVIDAGKLRDIIHWGINDGPVFTPEVDQILEKLIDACIVDLDDVEFHRGGDVIDKCSSEESSTEV